jgi:mannose/cellobiose epimerase-like protein (N-acyl-D-glucosamine 2-epimerase family)
MKRRAFLGTSIGTGVAAAGLAGCGKASTSSPNRVTGPDGKLAGKTLEELREEHRYWLFDDFLPFMDKFVIDHQLGGFMCTVDRDGTQLSSDKRTWYEGRGAWVYSYLYNKIKQDPKYLEVAKKSVEFIEKQNPLGKDLMPVGYTKEGKPLQDAPDPIFYGDVFVASGFQEYSKIKGNEKYWDMAKQILLKCVDIYDNRPGYGDLPPGPGRYMARAAAAQGGQGAGGRGGAGAGQRQGGGRGGRGGTQGARAGAQGAAGERTAAAARPQRGAMQAVPADENMPGVERPRVCGHWMVLLNCAQQMLENRDDAEVAAIASRSAKAVMDNHYNPDYGLINENLNHDLSRVKSDNYGQVCIGHGPETLWMILYDAVRTKDKELFERAAGYLERSADIFWDDVYGGLFAGLDNVEQNIWSVGQKSEWLQAEVLIGTLCVVEHTGAQWAKDWYEKLHTFVMNKLPLKQYGFPLWIAYADRKFTFVKNYNRCEHFHHPRLLMQNMLALDRMIKRGGKTSGLFG